MKSPITRIIPLLCLVFLSPAILAQCLEGEAYLSFEVTTDRYGYELYFEITPFDDPCGVNTLAAYGNTVVGCNGGGQKIATNSDNGAFGESTTAVVNYGCIPIGTQINIHAVDDWGDGKSEIGVRVNGYLVELFTADAATNSWTYTVNPPNNYDMLVDYNFEDANGWTLNHIPPVYDLYYPLSQLTNSETHMGLSVRNLGTQECTNVYARLNIDKLDEINANYVTVFTDTLKYGNIASDASKIRHKNIIDTDWYGIGKYRYVYTVHMDQTDQDESNNSLQNTFEITENYWSKTPLDNNNELALTNTTYFPGTSSYIDAYEWGSLFYFHNGNAVIIDKVNALLYSQSSALAASADVEIRVYKVNMQGTSLDIPKDLTFYGVAIESISHNPGNSVSLETSTIYEIASSGTTLGPLQNNGLYYISIYQQQNAPPYLSDGQTRNGFSIYGNSINQDFLSYASEINSIPYYNPLIIRDTGTDAVYNYGWTGGPEPALGVTLKDNPLKINDNRNTLNALLSPNPSNNQITLALNTAQDIDYTIVITDLSNRVIHLEKTKILNNSKQIEIAHLPSGTYFIGISSKMGDFYQKFIKN